MRKKTASFVLRSDPIGEPSSAMRASSQLRSQATIRAEEIRKEDDQIRFSPTVLETTQLRPKKEVYADKSVHSRAPYELNLSGSQLLVGLMSALSAVGLLLWVFLKLSLFQN
jgi:hypothetical protein